MTSPITVLYLIAKGRSGSNILSHVLGQLEGYCNVGELYHLWAWGLQDNARCGCGRPVRECDLWTRVMRSARLGGLEPATVARWQHEVLSWRAIPRLLATRPVDVAKWESLERYCAAKAALYQAIAEESGSNVVVDASKWPWDPTVLGLVPGIRVVLVHLVRDPRAVAHSWRRRKTWGDHEEGASEMPRFAAAYSALSWLARNLATELVRRRRPQVPWMRVRYEEFAAVPRDVVDAISQHTGVPAHAPFVDGWTIHSEPTHGVGGNSSKFSVGDVVIRADDEWSTTMSARNRWTVTALSAPLLRRYGYAAGGARPVGR